MELLKKLQKKNEHRELNGPATLGFFGDSVTNGCFELNVYDNDGEAGFREVCEQENGYVSKVRRILSMLYPRAQLNVINAGIAGDNARDALTRIDRDLLRFYPDLTVVCFGLNDVGFGKEALPAFREALHEIVHRLKAAGSEVILMTPEMPCTYLHPLVKGENFIRCTKLYLQLLEEGTFDRYMDTIRAVAEEEQVPLCDCCRKWKLLLDNGVDTTALLSNYINHPNREMHWLFAGALVETMFEN